MIKNKKDRPLTGFIHALENPVFQGGDEWRTLFGFRCGIPPQNREKPRVPKGDPRQGGFTLIEVLAVVAIIVVFLSVASINFNEIKGRLALKRAAYQMVQDLRRVQEMAMSSAKLESCASSTLPLYFSSLDYFALGGHIAKQDALVFCSASPNPAKINKSVTFTAEIIGGTGDYIYSWSGDCTGSESFCTESFSKPGTYQATITIRRGQEGIIADTNECSVDVSSQLIGVPQLLMQDFPIAKGYGIYINIPTNNKIYKLYADTTSDAGSDCETYSGPGTECWEYYNSADCIIETINIQEKGVIIQKINKTTFTPEQAKVSINFKPPNPDVKIKWLSGNEVEIVLALESDMSKTKSIIVNSAGTMTIR